MHSDDYGAYGIQQTSDEGFIVANASLSNDGDVSGNHGGFLYGDSWIVKLTVGKPTGINTTEASPFSIFPNPVQAQLNLRFSEPIDEITINIFDVHGKMIDLPVVYESTEAQVNTENLPPGFYTMQIINRKTSEICIEKFVRCK